MTVSRSSSRDIDPTRSRSKTCSMREMCARQSFSGMRAASILLAGQQAQLEIHEFPPAEIKKAVVGIGGGNQGTSSVHAHSTAAIEGRACNRPTRPMALPRRSPAS